jgi:uncharacterized protein (DUF433 family)
MNLEDYFDIQRPDDIRIRGTRIGIETVLYEHIHRSQTPEEIATLYPSLSQEQIYATILYYLHNRETINQYMSDWLSYCLQAESEQDHHPSPLVTKLRQRKTERTAQVVTAQQ